MGSVKFLVERNPQLAMIYGYLKYRWQVFKGPQDTSMGFRMIGNGAMQTGQFEPDETRIVTQILPFVDIVVNVGANIGYYCCIALSQEKRVIAFEPMEFNLRYLFRNIRANGWESQIEIYPMALSNQIGMIKIYGGGPIASLVKGWAGVPERYATYVPTTRLDDVLDLRLQGKKCLFLVDIEGAEHLMLEGAYSITKMKPKPIWMMEVTVSEQQPKGITINPNLSSTFHHFWDNDYEAWTADKQCRIIHPDEIEQIVRSGVDTLHTHNFLFIEKGKKQEFLIA